MNEQFYQELESARHNLSLAVFNSDWNVPLRVASEDIVILIDQILEERP